MSETMTDLDARQLLQHAMDETGLSDWADERSASP